MAQYEVNYSCGHTLARQLYGSNKKRQFYVKWAATQGLCPDCKTARQQAEREHESAQASATNAATGLPDLVGSPKQIAWAETIRAKALASRSNQTPKRRTTMTAGKIAAKAVTMGLSVDELVAGTDQVFEAAAAARRELEMQTSAKWWIDQRDHVDGQVYRAYEAADKRVFADVHARRDAEKEAAEEAKRQAFAEQQERVRLERIAYQAESVAKAATFAVGDGRTR